MKNNLCTRSWVEVSSDSLRSNVLSIREEVGGGCSIIPMVKADAYGLGVESILPALEACNPWGFGVATLEEGCHLRRIGVVKPVVVFSPMDYGSYCSALEAGLTITLSDLESLEQWILTSRKLNVRGHFQIEIDSGMGRAGFDWRTASEWGEILRIRIAQEDVVWSGTYTHFHSSDVDSDLSTEIQSKRFLGSVKILNQNVGMIHVCNSAAIFHELSLASDGVRPGIFMYGGQVGNKSMFSEEVVSIRAKVVLVRNVLANTTLGYGATYKSEKKEKWAVLGIGYGDGLPRRLGNCGHALLHGTRVPIIGRVSMDTIVVNTTDLLEVGVGDVATLIGKDREECITLEEMADLAETVSYEILTGLTPRLPRILV